MFDVWIQAEQEIKETSCLKKRIMITISLLVLDLMIPKSNYPKPRINVLATRIGTAATRPRVNTVGNVSTLEDRCGGNGDEWRLRRSDESSPPPELFWSNDTASSSSPIIAESVEIRRSGFIRWSREANVRGRWRLTSLEFGTLSFYGTQQRPITMQLR